MGLRATQKFCDVKLDTLRRWLRISAEHSEQVNNILMKDLDVDKVELDELWTFVKKNVPSLGCEPEEERWIMVKFCNRT